MELVAAISFSDSNRTPHCSERFPLAGKIGAGQMRFVRDGKSSSSVQRDAFGPDTTSRMLEAGG
jgi:hypothetical protein